MTGKKRERREEESERLVITRRQETDELLTPALFVQILFPSRSANTKDPKYKSLSAAWLGRGLGLISSSTKKPMKRRGNEEITC